MDRPELLDANVVRAWARRAVDALGVARVELDGVNVFPVADGDTGTNMYLTAREAAAAVDAAPQGTSGARLLRLAARAALLGARGNSGAILSEWLRGMTVAATRGDSLGRALDVAARSARQAVAHPEAGTILTAADSAAAAARHVEAGGMVGPAGAPARLSVLDAARRGAREAALRSVGTLAPLRAAGVLDAGACGLVLVLGALAAAQRDCGAGPSADAQGVSEAGGSMATVLLDMDLRGYAPSADGPALVVPGPAAAVGVEPGGPAAEDERADLDELELMFVLRRSQSAGGFRPGAVADALRADLDDVGTSVVVVGGEAGDPAGDDSLWQAHVHTPDLDAALDVARRWAVRGAVSRVHVRHLAVPPTDWAVVTTTSAPALAAELATGGAVVLLDLDVPPTRDDLALSVLGAGTAHVLVLAPPALLDGADLADVVGAHAGSGAREVPDLAVVPAATDVHLVTAVAALADALDAARDGGPPADVPGVVTAALARLHVAGGTVADAGDALAGLLDDVAEGPGPGTGVEIVTLLTDAGVPAEAVSALAARAAEATGGAEVVVTRSGRPGDRVEVGAERGTGY